MIRIPVVRWRPAVSVAAVALALLILDKPALAADPEVAISIENNRFQPDEVKVAAGAPFVLAITNKDKGPEEFESKELRIEKIVPAGKTVKVRVPALKPGTYGFFGEYHEKTAKGRIVAQ